MLIRGIVSEKLFLHSSEIIQFVILGYYGICLASYPHNDVVNSVAFNPKDDQMFISTSDDYEIKIWRSQESVREQGIAPITRANEVKNKHKKNTV